MICESFEKLTPLERVKYIGEVIHGIQNDDTLFKLGEAIILVAQQKGLFQGVIINPPKIPQSDAKI